MGRKRILGADISRKNSNGVNAAHASLAGTKLA